MDSIIFIEATTTGAGYKGIEIAKSLDLNIILLAKNKRKYDECGISTLCDYVFETDTDDESALLKFINQIKENNDFNIISVMTFADFYVPQAAYVAEALNLPTIPYESARNCRNKYYMRKEIDKINSKYNPKYYIVDSIQEALEKAKDIGYPLILKPQDENDSFNVLLIRNQDELKEKFYGIYNTAVNRIGQKKDSHALLLEQYMSSQEYSVETYSTETYTEIIGVTKKIVSGQERGQFIEIAHIFPYIDVDNKIFESVKEIIEGMGIKNAICHTEVKIENGELKIVEINPRLAGGGIGSEMIELSTGLSAIRYCIDLSLGKQNEWRPLEKNVCVIYKLQADKKGKLVDINIPEKIIKTKNFVKFERFIENGTQVREPILNGDLLGYILMVGTQSEDVYSMAEEAIKNINIEIKNN